MTPQANPRRLEWKLTRLIVGTCAVVLLLSGAVTLTYESVQTRQEMLRDGLLLVDLIGENSAAAVASGDAVAAGGLLASLKFRPEIVSAAIYQRDGKRLAQYVREKRDAPLTLDPATAIGPRFEDHELVVLAPLRLGQEVVGTVALRGDFSEQRTRFQAYSLITVGLLVGLLILAFGFASLLQRTISRPIHELAEVVGRVARNKDYTLRAVQRDNDEIGSLAEAFNSMLTQIERQNRSLLESEERFRLITENIREVFWMTDADKARMLYISPGYEKIWGRTCESLYQSPRAWVEAIKPEDRDRVLEAALTKQIKGEYDEQYRIVRPDGALRWIRDRAFPVRDETGSVFHIVGIAADITAGKQSELAKEALLLLGTQLNTASRPVEAARAILAAADKLWQWDSATLDLYSLETDQMQAVLNCDIVDGQRREVPAARASGVPSPLMRRILESGPELILREPPFTQTGDAVMFGDTSRCSASIMCVPLCGQGQSVGVFSLHSYTPKAYTKQDVEALQALADHCGGALGRIRFYESLQESDARFRQLGEATFEGLVIIDEGKVVDGNSQLATLLGYALSEMIGRSVLDFVAPGSREMVAERMRSDSEEPYEVLNLRKDGSVFPAESHARRLTWQGRPVRVTAIRDLTERKRAEVALRESEEKFQKAFLGAPVLMSLSEVADGRYVAVNEQFCALSGFRQAEVLGRTSVELGWLSATDRHRIMTELASQGRVRDLELTLHCKDGRELICLCAAERVVVGGRTLLLSIASDITSRKRTEDALWARQHEISEALEFNQRILNTSSVGILTYDESGQCLFANAAAAKIAGTNVAGLLAENFLQLPSWKACGLYDAAFRALHTGTEQVIETRLTTTFGKTVWLIARFSSFYSVQNKHLLVFMSNITGRKRAEGELQETKQHLEAHLTNSPLAVVEFDPDNRVIRWSGAAQQIFGWTQAEVLGKGLHEIRWVHEDDAESVRQVSVDLLAGRGQRNRHVNRNYRQDGAVIQCEWYNSALYDGQGRLTSIFSLVLDITERQQAEQLLHDNEARLRTVLDTAYDGIITIGERGTMESLNQAAVKMFGYSVDEAVGQNVTLLMPSPYREQHDRYLANYYETGVRKVIGLGREASGRRKDGSIFPVELFVSEMRLDGRRSFTSIVRDITQRKRAEEELRESEGRFRTLFEASPIAIAVQGADGRMLQANDSYQKMLGYTEEELRNLGVKRITHPEDVAEGNRFYHELVDGIRDRYQREKRYCRKDGEVIWAASTVSAIRSPEGKLRYLLSTVEDVTARRQAERVTRELASIVEHSADAIIGQTAEGLITSWNKAAEQIYGYPAAAVLGQSLLRFMASSHGDQVKRAMNRLRDGYQVEEFETVCHRKDGTLIEVAMTISPIRNQQGQFTGASSIARDITERKWLEREVVRIGDDERRRISHELHDSLGQTLTGIAFMAKALQNTLAQSASPLAKDMGEIAKLINGVNAESRRLAHGLAPIEVETLGLGAALARLAAEAQHMFRLECVFHCAEANWQVNPAIGAALYRITQEAIHNAVAHGSPRNIGIELARSPDQLRLCVSDDGKGFAPSGTADSGLGLRIMRHRAQAIGGQLNILSQPGQGTRIECLIPADKLSPVSHLAEPPPTFRDRPAFPMTSPNQGDRSPAEQPHADRLNNSQPPPRHPAGGEKNLLP